MHVLKSERSGDRLCEYYTLQIQSDRIIWTLCVCGLCSACDSVMINDNQWMKVCRLGENLNEHSHFPIFLSCDGCSAKRNSKLFFVLYCTDFLW